MSSLIFIFKVKRLSRRGKLCFVMHVFRAIKKHPVPRFASCTRQRTAVNKSLLIMAVGGRNISVKYFLCSKARVQRCFRYDYSKRLRAFALRCLFSRIVSLRVFSETSLGKRVNLVLSDFNHLLDWEAEVFKVWFFVFEVSC